MSHWSHPARLTVMVLLAALLGIATPALAKPLPSGAKVIHERTTNYHHIQVYDLNGVRTLSFDGSEESIMDLKNPTDSGFEYISFFHAPFAINGAIRRVLIVGLGGASAAKQFQHYYPDVTLDIVELDPAVVEVAKEYFAFTPGPKTHIYVMDGRQFLKGTTAKYDLILMDAYASNPYGSFIPWHLATSEFFALAKSRMNPGGLLAYNVIGQLANWRK
ncbi:MAG: fused MFS/spermidine synthase, partial [bacterium]